MLIYIGGRGKHGKFGGKYGYIKYDKNLKLSEQKYKIFKNENIKNNEADYMALIKYLETMKEDESAYIMTNNMLLEKHFNEKWKIKEKRLRDLLQMSKSICILKRLKLNVCWIPRKYNKMVLILEKENDKVSFNRKKENNNPN